MTGGRLPRLGTTPAEIDESMSDAQIRAIIWLSIQSQISVLIREMAAEGFIPSARQAEQIAEAFYGVYRSSVIDTLAALGRLPAGSDARH